MFSSHRVFRAIFARFCLQNGGNKMPQIANLRFKASVLNHLIKKTFAEDHKLLLWVLSHVGFIRLKVDKVSKLTD